jgi:nucleoside-diphosphate-sugar epimerase
MVKRLKKDGYYVRALSRSPPRFEPSQADECLTMDLRYMADTDPLFEGVDEVYQYAAIAGSIAVMEDHEKDAETLRTNALINLHVLEACRHYKVPKVLFASTACMYPSVEGRAARESDAYPMQEHAPAYSWEKVFSEKLYASYGRKYGIDCKIARYHSTYGPYIEWQDPIKARAPAALCRKIAEQPHFGGKIEIWGDGQQSRSFMAVGDAIEGTRRLMNSDFAGPVNIGSAELVTINQLAHVIMMVARKQCEIVHIEGATGVRGRSSDQTLIREKLGWSPSTPLYKGIAELYAWVDEQVNPGKRKAAPVILSPRALA